MEDLAEALVLAEKRGVVAVARAGGGAVIAPLELPEALGEDVELLLQVLHDRGVGHVERAAAEDPVGVIAGDLRFGVHGVDEGVDELAHVVLAQVLAGGVEVGAVPVAGAIPPAPVAMIHVGPDAAHEVGDAEDLAEGAVLIGLAAGPADARLAPAGAFHPVAEHPDGGEPALLLAGVIPQVAVLPVEALVAGVVEVVAIQADEGLRGGDGRAGGEGLLVAEQLKLRRDRVALKREARPPVSEVVPADEQAVFRVLAIQREPGGVGGGAHAEAVAADRAAVAGVAHGAGDADMSGFRRGPDAGGVLAVVGVLIAHADERRAGGVVLRLAPLAVLGVVDEIDELAVFDVPVAPAALALLAAELLGGGVGLAVGIGERRVERGGVPADVLVHVHKEHELVAGGDIGADIEGHRDRRVRDVLPALGGPDLLVIQENLRIDAVAGEVLGDAGHGLIRVELARLVRAEGLRLEDPRAGVVLAAGHPVEVEGLGVGGGGGEAQETRIGEPHRGRAGVGEADPLADDAGVRVDDVALRHLHVAALQGDVELQLALLERRFARVGEEPAAGRAGEALAVLAHAREELIGGRIGGDEVAPGRRVAEALEHELTVVESHNPLHGSGAESPRVAFMLDVGVPAVHSIDSCAADQCDAER